MEDKNKVELNEVIALNKHCPIFGEKINWKSDWIKNYVTAAGTNDQDKMHSIETEYSNITFDNYSAADDIPNDVPDEFKLMKFFYCDWNCIFNITDAAYIMACINCCPGTIQYIFK